MKNGMIDAGQDYGLNFHRVLRSNAMDQRETPNARRP